MSGLSMLINNTCPTGIECYSLGEIENMGLISLGRGNVISKKEMQENPGNYPVYSSSVTGDGEIGRYGKYMFDDERITWSIDGGGKLFYRNGLKYSVTNVGGWIKVLDRKLSTKFLYYVLIDQWIQKSFDYTKKAHPSVIRDEYIVPLPPIEVQNEIVRILNNFTGLISELTAELTARQKQYGYYQDLLLARDGKEYTLDEVCQIVDCPHTSPKWKETGVPVIRNYNLVNGIIDTSKLSYVDEQEYAARVKRIVPQENDILFSREAPIGNVGIVPANFKCCQGQRVVLLRPNPQIVMPQFLIYVLQSEAVKEQINRVEKIGSTVSNFNISDLKKLKFSIPPIEYQDEISKKIEVFSRICADIFSGLPAEIAARQKQYEYYRNKLLSFTER